MKADTDIKKDVEAELKWSPDVDDTDIAVQVTSGEVSLSGYARNYFEKIRAETAVKRIKGVVAVANDLEVRSAYRCTPTDPEIARAAIAALRYALPWTWENIKPVVQRGWIALEGTLEWQYQREQAESAVRYLSGVDRRCERYPTRAESCSARTSSARSRKRFGESRKSMQRTSRWMRRARMSLCGVRSARGPSETRLSSPPGPLRALPR